MGDNVRSIVKKRLNVAVPGAFGVVAIAALLAGCSTDVSRFDYPAFGLTNQRPQDRPIPSEPIYDNAAPAHAEGYTPNGAPPPEYGSEGPRGLSQGYASDRLGPPPVLGAGVPNYGSSTYASNGQPSGFGTVQGQPESYHPERLASNGRTAYIVSPGAGSPPAGNYAQGTGQATVNAAPAMSPPVSQDSPGLRPHRPASGALVEVMPGETLYQFARRNGVSIAALMQANNMRSPLVHPGDKLLIPGKGGRSILPPIASTPAPTVSRSAEAAALPDPGSASAFTPSASEGTNADGTYTVRAGDSIYSIARKSNIRPEDIMAVNGITDVTKVRFGQVLKMPGGSGGPLKPLSPASIAQPGPRFASLQSQSAKPGAAAAPAAPVMSDADQDGVPDGGAADSEDGAPAAPVAGAAPAAAPAKVASKPTAAWSPSKPLPTAAHNAPVDPASVRVASTTPAAAAAATEAAPAETPDVPSDGRFRWPVHGRIIGKFGPAGKGGQQNEGIDLAVPLGTEVHAAENGVVAYSGDELKGYGKLVLIRHADNWVTAYAHNDELLVKRGDQIRRGQVIAKAGKSGGIDQPLLHFELRKGSQPVDPLPHMASN